MLLGFTFSSFLSKKEPLEVFFADGGGNEFVIIT